MQVVDLQEQRRPLYFACLEDWNPEMGEAGDHKARWYAKMASRGLGVKLALDDRGEVGGMIQYGPVEYAAVEGRDLYFVYCVWVHGHRAGRGDFQGRGMGRALLEAAEADARARGAKGLVTWGLALPVWMRASWFRKRGYRKVDRLGLQVLLWKRFTPDAVPPRLMRPRRLPEPVPGKVAVTALVNGWCPGLNLAFERARRAAADLGDDVVFRAVDTSERDAMVDWGMSDALFVDGKPVRTGPPPSYRRIRSVIERRLRRLWRRRAERPLA